jgi:hypothetical protein
MTGFHRTALAAVLLVTGFAYHGALRNGFVWDDVHMIVNNRALDSLGSAPRWFTQPETTSALQDVNYRPVLVASFAIDVAVWGRRPAGFHATNLAIHLGVVLLAYVLARRVWRDPWSVTVAALVALHRSRRGGHYVSPAVTAQHSVHAGSDHCPQLPTAAPSSSRGIFWFVLRPPGVGRQRNLRGPADVDRALGSPDIERRSSMARKPASTLPWWGLSAVLAWRTALLAAAHRPVQSAMIPAAASVRDQNPPLVIRVVVPIGRRPRWRGHQFAEGAALSSGRRGRGEPSRCFASTPVSAGVWCGSGPRFFRSQPCHG